MSADILDNIAKAMRMEARDMARPRMIRTLTSTDLTMLANKMTFWSEMCRTVARDVRELEGIAIPPPPVPWGFARQVFPDRVAPWASMRRLIPSWRRRISA